MLLRPLARMIPLADDFFLCVRRHQAEKDCACVSESDGGLLTE